MRLLNALRSAVVKPVLSTSTAQPNKAVTSRRARRFGTILYLDDVAAFLSAAKPFFKMRSGGTYAVRTTRKLVDGKMQDVPTNFIRVDKDRTPLKQRKRMRRAARHLAEATV